MSYLYSWIPTFVLLLALGGIHPMTSWAQNKKISVSVQVANKTTMEPMPAAVKAILPSTGMTIAIAKGDPASGIYELSLPVGQLYVVEAIADGFRISSAEVDLRQDPNATSILLLLARKDGYITESDIDIPPSLLTTLQFDGGSLDLSQEATKELRRVFILMRQNPEIILSLHGHTDVKGSPEYNIHLSELRARQVWATLVSKGIPAYRLKYYGYGNMFPFTENPKERELNNRVEFHLMP
ncbi:MAG: OmpA family protein [Bacteroidota bacterium]